MNIAIIGGGFTGLTSAYELSKKGHHVTVFEKESYLGGLAFGFKEKHWDWHLEYAYHHLFTNDDAIIGLIHEVGLEEKLIIKRPITASLYKEKIYQLDSVSSLLSFPGMPFVDRLRTGAFIAALKLNPFWQPLEQMTAKQAALMIGGKNGWKAIWEPLMVGKFSTYADSIAASWLWARIKKRTPSLAYIEGGFQTLIHTLEDKIKQHGGTIKKGITISHISLPHNQSLTSNLQSLFTIHHSKKEVFDSVILTTPTPIAQKLLLSSEHSRTTNNESRITNFQSYFKLPLTVPHLHAQVMILETKEPILKDIYWLNITDRRYPFLAVVAHTNYMDKKHYGGNHITYIGNYLPDTHPFLKMTKDQLLKKFLPYLKKLSYNSEFKILNSNLFTGPFAQPVHEKNYSTRAPKLKISLPPEASAKGGNLYLANMDSIYPWDRGTNYAVELGQKVAQNLLNQEVL